MGLRAGELASDTGASYDYYADVIIVGFKATATQADRQAAIDSINGTVVGGQPMPRARASTSCGWKLRAAWNRLRAP